MIFLIFCKIVWKRTSKKCISSTYMQKHLDLRTPLFLRRLQMTRIWSFDIAKKSAPEILVLLHVGSGITSHLQCFCYMKNVRILNGELNRPPKGLKPNCHRACLKNIEGGCFRPLPPRPWRVSWLMTCAACVYFWA